jgi:MoxR-like ATPase
MTTKPQPLTDWQKAEFAIQHSNRVLLYGLPGTGKTYFGLNASLKGRNSYRLICTEEMTDADLIGCYKQNKQGTWSFAEGVGIKAWREGARLVVDEINRMNGDVESRMMALIDSVKSSSWQHPDTGEVVKPHKDFSVVATMNGLPEDLAPAILDRLTVRCQVNDPHPDALASLPEYLRGIAQTMTSPNARNRYSLRSFVEFNAMYQASNNLEHCAQVLFPEDHTSVTTVLKVGAQKASDSK